MPDLNSQIERKQVLLNEITATVGSVFMSLQIGCAQCHDHKYDAISQADFYRLRAFFDAAIDVEKNQSVSRLSMTADGATMSHLLIRGDWRRPGPAVAPAFLRIADRSNLPAPMVDPAASRSALAAWLTSPDHPLTARSIVNRIWQHHFGRGLSDTPSDFGVMGNDPTHPELLDHLALEFIARGWRMKDLHRAIVLSATYRLASYPDKPDENWERLQEVDPANDLLGRFPRRRLEAEAVRDALFAVSESLNRATDGPGVMPPLPAEVASSLLKGQWTTSARTSDHYRRSVYLFARRNLPYPFFATFDRPSANQTCAARSRSTTAVQSLALLNSDLTSDAAERLAAVCLTQHPTDRGALVDELYRRLFARMPDAAERDEVLAFWKATAAQGESEAIIELCRGLLNTNEFIYVD